MCLPWGSNCTHTYIILMKCRLQKVTLQSSLDCKLSTLTYFVQYMSVCRLCLYTAWPLWSEGVSSLVANDVFTPPLFSSSARSINLSSKSTGGFPGSGSWVRYERSYIRRFFIPPKLLLSELRRSPWSLAAPLLRRWVLKLLVFSGSMVLGSVISCLYCHDSVEVSLTLRLLRIQKAAHAPMRIIGTNTARIIPNVIPTWRDEYSCWPG